MLATAVAALPHSAQTRVQDVLIAVQPCQTDQSHRCSTESAALEQTVAQAGRGVEIHDRGSTPWCAVHGVMLSSHAS